MIAQHRNYNRLTLIAVGMLCALPARSSQADADSPHWSSLITAGQLHSRLEDPNLLIIDVRSAKEYAAGHIPGAINVPGSEWRTPPTDNPAEQGVGSRIFRKSDGTLNVARYEKLLSAAGVTPNHEVIVYGNHAGKADGSVPAAILLKLGHPSVAFLDGVGVEVWQQAGYELSHTPHALPPSQYRAPDPDPNRLWSLDDVLANLNNREVVFVDSRSPDEYEGTDRRNNKRGGHIPGALLLNEEEFLRGDKTTVSLEQALKKIASLNIPQDKTVVIYCQTGTRCSHKELIFKDLGYKNVVLYDASWQEWGNRDDTPIEVARPESDKPAKD